MKKILYLLLLVFPFMAFAQETEERPPLLKEGRIWKYWAGNYWTEYRFSEYVQGDTLIEGNVWKKIYQGTYPDGTYEKAMREEGGKVYVYDERGSSLFLDYDAPIGEEFCHQYNRWTGELEQYVKVVGRDTLHNSGYVYDTVELNQYSNHPVDSDTLQWSKTGTSRWIVGIGGDCGIYEAVYWDGVPGLIVVLTSVRDGDNYLYRADPPILDLSVSPIEMPSPSGRCYDLQGRRLNAQPSHGVYIRDRRKYVR